MSGVVSAVVGMTPAVFSASAYPASASGFRRGTGTATTLSSVSVTITGGIAPYTVLWTRTGGDSSTYAVNDLDTTTYFQRYTESIGDFNSTWKCTVTDSVAAFVDTNSVFITLSRTT